MEENHKNRWEKIKLGEIGEIVGGGTPSTKRAEYWNGDILWLTPTEVTSMEGRYIEETLKHITKLGLKNSSAKLMPAGTIIMTSRATIGEVVMNRVPMATNQGFINIVCEKVYALFLYYWIKANKKLIILNSHGTTFNEIIKSVFKKIKILIPPLPIQHKIASILSAYDDLIENNNRRIKILEEMAQTIYNEWFVKFRFPEYKKVKMVDSELGKIPEGWEVRKLKNIVETQYGYTESASKEQIGPRFLRGTDINKATYINWDSVPFCEISKKNFKKYRLRRKDIVIIRMADPGKVGIIEKNIEAVFGSYLIRLKIILDKITPYYLFYFMQSDRYQKYITRASTGTTRKSASAGVITDIDIYIPPFSLLIEFENQMVLLRRQLNLFIEKNAILRHARDLLLPKLISGQIAVENLDINVEDII